MTMTRHTHLRLAAVLTLAICASISPASADTLPDLDRGSLARLDRAKIHYRNNVEIIQNGCACWNWALAGGYVHQVDPNSTKRPDDVFAFLNGVNDGTGLEDRLRNDIAAIDTRNATASPQREQAIRNALVATARAWDLSPTNADTNYRLVIEYLKTSDTGRPYPPNWQHWWIEVRDTSGRWWVVESFPGRNAVVQIRAFRQASVNDTATYGMVSINIADLSMVQVLAIQSILGGPASQDLPIAARGSEAGT